MWYIGIYFLHKYLHPIYFKNAHISQLLDFIAIQQLHGSAGKNRGWTKAKAASFRRTYGQHRWRQHRSPLCPQSEDNDFWTDLRATVPIPFSEHGTRHDRTWDETQSNAGRDAIERGRAFADKYRDWRANALQHLFHNQCYSIEKHCLSTKKRYEHLH